MCYYDAVMPWHPERGKGDLEERWKAFWTEKEYSDPIAHFRAEAKRLEARRKVLDEFQFGNTRQNKLDKRCQWLIDEESYSTGIVFWACSKDWRRPVVFKYASEWITLTVLLWIVCTVSHHRIDDAGQLCAAGYLGGLLTEAVIFVVVWRACHISKGWKSRIGTSL